MKKYLDLQIDVLKFSDKDVLDNPSPQTPLIPFPGSTNTDTDSNI